MWIAKEDAIREHRKMWNWIADTSEKEQRFVTKNEYIKEKDYEKFHISSNCFCCEYSRGDCFFCPLKWHDKQEETYKSECPCMHPLSPFRAYDVVFLYNRPYEVSIEEFVKAAREIANLEERFIDWGE